MDELELKDYIAILRRRKYYFFTVACAIFLLSVMFAMRLSNYRATATVEIAPPEISAAAASPSGVSISDYMESLADLRISHLQQKVLSTASLIEIITKFDLYPGARKTMPIAAVAEGMRKKVKIDLVGSTLANPSSATRSADALSAIAFTLSFDYSVPLITQQVTNELVLRFLEEDLKDRRKSAHETSAFLESQIKALEAAMVEQEKNIAEFRSANEGADPEYLTFNQQAAQSMLMSIQNIDTQLATNLVTQGTLRGQLASVDPYSRVVADGQVMTTPSIQLKALKTQYSTLSAQYGPQHPDVVKVRNQMRALERQVGKAASNTTSELKAKIEDTQTNLAAARKTYGADHPDVKGLERQLERFEKELSQAQQNPDSQNSIVSDADNPTYLQISSQLKAQEEQYAALMKQKDVLLEEQKKYHSAISKNPVVIQKMAALTRDYENAQLRYRALKEKKMAADMSETIEQERSGQRLVVLNPPELPLHTQPSRSLFVMGGFVLAILGGLATVFIKQVLSKAITGPHQLESIAGAPPLVVIPYIASSRKRGWFRARRTSATTGDV